MLHSICQQSWKTQQQPQDWKRSVFIPIPKKDNTKECSNYRIILLISYASKVMFKILNSLWTKNFKMFKLDLEKAEVPEIKLSIFVGSQKKQESSRETLTSASLTMPKPLRVWITTNWKILQEMWIPDHLTCLLRNLYTGQEPDKEQQIGSKLGKEHVKTVYCHRAYLT